MLRFRRPIAGLLVALAMLVVAAWFYPIHVDATIPFDAWLQRMWLRGSGTWNWI